MKGSFSKRAAGSFPSSDTREISRHILPTNPTVYPDVSPYNVRKLFFSPFFLAMISPVHTHKHVRSPERFSLVCFLFSPGRFYVVCPRSTVISSLMD